MDQSLNQSLACGLRSYLSGSGSSAYTTTANDYDGSNDYAGRGQALTGAVDSKVGLTSLWIRLDADGATQRIMAGAIGAADRFNVIHLSSNKFRVFGTDAGGTIKLSMATVLTYTSGATWLHVLFSWDLANDNKFIYINDVSDLAVTTFLDAAIDHTGDEFMVGALSDGSTKVNGCLSELWFGLEYLDLSVAANRRKFIDAAGKPVDLGADGSTPTGTQPLLYLPDGDPSDNKGSGGDLIITGALTACSTSPTD